ncbi:hypothetical protein GQF01_34865 [Paenibacillus sp. 5J-6]|jgi:hypothetical protein|uniref:Uncharacterized protein n=1 Tax=Paenibacillus silvestris TaxID=2606219 RepID=A0A6L8VCE5_9BACL|nr:hypothetical protein [Paenibacillus silvestris]MZQ87312.1 hypothetical protein [Paenibacillus silvestris]
MFDPTIYDNIKVVLEGAVYDLDLDGKILITRREDLVDLSSMSRTYAIEFARKIDKPSKAEINLHVHLSDLAAEILENPTAKPGCTLTIKLFTKVKNPEIECKHIEEQLGRIWEHRPQITQLLSYKFGIFPMMYHNQISLSFGRKVDESHLDDFPHLIGYAADSLTWLDERGG